MNKIHKGALAAFVMFGLWILAGVAILFLYFI